MEWSYFLGFDNRVGVFHHFSFIVFLEIVAIHFVSLIVVEKGIIGIMLEKTTH